MTMTWQCPQCLRYRGNLTCDAFPSGIPEMILTGQHDHRKEHEDDDGMTYKPIPPDVMERYLAKALLTRPQLIDHTKQLADKDDVGYKRVKEILTGMGYVATDFEEGGPFYGWSTNELIEFARNKRD